MFLSSLFKISLQNSKLVCSFESLSIKHIHGSGISHFTMLAPSCCCISLKCCTCMVLQWYVCSFRNINNTFESGFLQSWDMNIPKKYLGKEQEDYDDTPNYSNLQIFKGKRLIELQNFNINIFYVKNM